MIEIQTKISGILFDLDGTLHSREAAFWRWIEAEEEESQSEERLNRDTISALDGHGKGDKQKLLAYLDQTLSWKLSPKERTARFRRRIVEFVQIEPGAA